MSESKLLGLSGNCALQFCSLLILFGLSLSSIQTTHAQTLESQRSLSEPDILYLLSGSTLYGEYTDGRPPWAEQTAATGQLFDVTDEWREVGSWTVIADMACYRYVDAGGLSCFDVYEAAGVYYFYTPGTDQLIAYTTRIDRPPMM